ncbi:MAG: hypothetical protein LBH43_05445 [Treponema sp.]|jgi:hypothetical protein|nr:hypothetical protein [Treponema sp.]
MGLNMKEKQAVTRECKPLSLNIPKPSKRGGQGGEKPEEPACGTSWFYSIGLLNPLWVVVF